MNLYKKKRIKDAVLEYFLFYAGLCSTVLPDCKRLDYYGISMLKSISFNNFLMWLWIGWQQAVSQSEVMVESPH